MMNFAETMYKLRSEKRLEVGSYLVGYPVPAGKGAQRIVPLSCSMLNEFANGSFEELSPANKAFKHACLGKTTKQVKNKKHLRLHCKAKDLNNWAIAEVGGFDRDLWTVDAETWERALDEVEQVKGQRNKGYALELVIHWALGLEWNPKKRGVDLDEGHIEIKYFNGQIEL